MTESWTGLNRRTLLGASGFMGLGAVAAAVMPARIVAQPLKAEAYMVSEHDAHAEVAVAAGAQDDEMTADEMDAHHEAGVKLFPAATEGLGGQPLPFEMDGDVKVFRVSCQVVQWEHSPGTIVEAFTYNGVVPGPEIRVTEGDTFRLLVTNEMPQSTAVHFHGLRVPFGMDGVPFITQDPIKPGQTFAYEFKIKVGNAGSHMYHSHHNSTEQVTKGLLGAMIVDPIDSAMKPRVDLEYTMVLGDGPIGGFHINGKGFPATAPVVMRKGQRLLCRYMNEGLAIHPMHLHGFPMQVIAQDGYMLPQPYYCDTLNIAPGQRFDVIIEPDEVGVWAWHCHILSHAETRDGMFGMVTALIVEE